MHQCAAHDFGPTFRGLILPFRGQPGGISYVREAPDLQKDIEFVWTTEICGLFSDLLTGTQSIYRPQSSLKLWAGRGSKLMLRPEKSQNFAISHVWNFTSTCGKSDLEPWVSVKSWHRSCVFRPRFRSFRSHISASKHRLCAKYPRKWRRHWLREWLATEKCRHFSVGETQRFV